MNEYSHLFPTSFGRYIEPFLGGGAVFFQLSPSESLLADVNSALIGAYAAVRDHHADVYSRLSHHAIRHSREYYYRVRAQAPQDQIEAAARLIYLNRTCWNGLYRVNRSGVFNVPIGTKTNVLLEKGFGDISSALRNTELVASDFEDIINRSKRDDFVFVDPPYTVKHNNNGFIKYNENIFTWADQERLRTVVGRAIARGSKVLISNAGHPSIADLYSGTGEIHSVVRQSVIAGKAAARGREQEFVIKCY